MTVGLHRSRLLLLILSALHGLAIWAIMATPWPDALRFGASAVVLVLWWWAIRHARPSCESLRLCVDGSLLAVRSGGLAEKMRVLPGAYVHPLLTVFRLQGEATVSQTIVVMVDSMSATDRRLLRVWLRWQLSADGSPTPDDA